jgi:hypothetical protein
MLVSQEAAASSLMNEFASLAGKQQVQVIRPDSEGGKGSAVECDSTTLVAGDIVEIKFGDKTPATIIMDTAAPLPSSDTNSTAGPRRQANLDILFWEESEGEEEVEEAAPSDSDDDDDETGPHWKRADTNSEFSGDEQQQLHLKSDADDCAKLFYSRPMEEGDVYEITVSGIVTVGFVGFDAAAACSGRRRDS